jgi:hypothetical protein
LGTEVVRAARQFFHAEDRRHRRTERHDDELVRQRRKHHLQHVRQNHVPHDLHRGKAEHFGGFDFHQPDRIKTGALDLAQIRARIERRPDQHRRERRQGHADLGQREEQEENLHELRRVGREDHIRRDSPAQKYRPVAQHRSAYESDDHAERKREHGNLQAEPCTAKQIRPLLENGLEM